MTERVDVAVVGAGPAGAAAAAACARAGVSVTLIEGVAVGGEALNIEEPVELPARHPLPGPDLAAALIADVLEEGVDLRLGGQATAVGRADGVWRVATRDGELHARALLLCTGSEFVPLPNRLPVEEDPLYGRGLFTCATCDSPLYSQKRVAVAGGGDTGVGAALTLSRYAAEVVLYEREAALTAHPALTDALARVPNVELRLRAEVTDAQGESTLSAVRVVDRGTAATEPADGLMLAVGLRPRSQLVAELVERDRNGAIRVDRDLAASASGIFAAGDVREGAAYRCAAAWEDGLAAARGALALFGAV